MYEGIESMLHHVCDDVEERDLSSLSIVRKLKMGTHKPAREKQLLTMNKHE